MRNLLIIGVFLFFLIQYIESPLEKTVQAQIDNTLTKTDLNEIVTLNWGSYDNSVGCNKTASINKIANTFRFYYGPYDFYIDKNEYIYIADNFNGRVIKLKNEKLSQIYYFKEVVCFDQIQVDNKENLYIIINDSNCQKVFKYNSEGKFLGDYSLVLENSNQRTTLDIYFLNFKDQDEQKRIFENCYNYVITKYSKDRKIKKRFFIENSIGPIRDWTVDIEGTIYIFSSPVTSEEDTYKFYSYKKNTLKYLFSLKEKNKYNSLDFIGKDENGFYYFCEKLKKYYLPKDKDKIKGIIIFSSDGIISQEGFLIYKYNVNGELLKTVKVDDPIPYHAKVDLKGNIYITPFLGTEALLSIPLDKYRIYKFSI